MSSAVFLAENRCSLVCVHPKEELPQHTVDMIEQSGQGAGATIPGDVTNAADHQRFVDLVISNYGSLDIS